MNSVLSSRLSVLVLTGLVGLFMSGSARAQSVGNCAAADSSYGVALNCSGVCTISGADVTCNTTTVCSGAADTVNAIAVQDFGNTGNHDFEVFGQCSPFAQWCCSIDDTMMGTLTTLDLIGTPNDDDLALSTIGNENLGPHRMSGFLGFIHGGDGDDTIIGSDVSSATYRDNLYGNTGDDSMTGKNGGDWMDGGPGNDNMYGDGGDDAMIGGDGDDYLEGNDGQDAVCDASANLAGGCVTSGQTTLHGNNANDIVFYACIPGCTTEAPNAASSCDAGNGDVWGSNSATCGPWTQPGDCESNRSTWPAACNDPNSSN